MPKLKAAFCIALWASCVPAAAQTGRELRRAADAAIVSDIARDRQAEHDARRQPYGSPGYGNIRTANGARTACAAKAREEAGHHSMIIGRLVASTMSTGWEVEGQVRSHGERGSVPFVCSVRNGSVSGVLLNPDR